MEVITRKSDIKLELDACLEKYSKEDITPFIKELYQRILTKKVKFPLLEYCAHEIVECCPENTHIIICDSIEELKTEGGNVLLGIILQDRLPKYFDESFTKATEYISKADIWYVCDIIGERVYGQAFIDYPDKTLAKYKKLSKHPANWVVRALGAGGHFALKRGLSAKYAEQLFKLLLSMANTKDKEIRQGVGWAAKTTAKFHPEIIEKYETEIKNDEVANWFRKKIEIGLKRNTYAKRSRG